MKRHHDRRPGTDRSALDHPGPSGKLKRVAACAGGALLGLLAHHVFAKRRMARRRSTSTSSSCAFLPNQPGQPTSAWPQAESALAFPDHERSDVSLPLVAIFLVLLLLAAVVIHTALWWWLNSMKEPPPLRQRSTSTAVASPGVRLHPPVPQLQISPQNELREYLLQQARQLNEPGQGIGASGAPRLPIERAMALLVERDRSESPGTNRNRAGVSPLELQRQRSTQPTTEPR